MLEVDYSTKFGEQLSSVSWDIELPIEWTNYFEERGEIASYVEDQRNHKRLKIRTHGLLWFDRTLPFLHRNSNVVGIYTRDFSRQGCGFLVPYQLYPEERVRIVLPTFWVQLHVVRARRITSKCYEIGATLMRRMDPDVSAFDVLSDDALAAAG